MQQQTSIKFQVPNKKKRETALGQFEPQENNLQQTLLKIINLNKVIKLPKQGEWLHENPQEGQTFNIYKSRLKMKEGNPLTKDKNVIYILILDLNISKDFQEKIQQYCQAFFQTKVQIINDPKLYIKSNEIFCIKHFKDIKIRTDEFNNKQYCAPDIFNKIDRFLPKDGFCIVGITEKDLYIDEENNFVFGVADPRARKAVISYARYFENQIYEKKNEKLNEDINEKNEKNEKNTFQNQIEKVVLERICKVIAHEITHLFGVRHCAYYQCIMNGSNSLDEDDTKPSFLCGICLRKLIYGQSQFQEINIIKRYNDLLTISKQLNFQQTYIQYYNQILQELQNQ